MRKERGVAGLSASSDKINLLVGRGSPRLPAIKRNEGKRL